MDDRTEHERRHARDVLITDPEGIWGWGTPAGQARARRRARLIVEAGGIVPGCRALEIGCGTGLFTSLVSGFGAELTACELSQELLDVARNRDYASPVRFITGDAAELRGEHDGAYDVVWGSSVLHHLDMDVFLPVALRLLRPGGRFVFAEPNMLNPQIWLERHVPAVRRKVGASPDETAFTRFALSRMLSAAGFRDVSVRPHEFLHPSTPGVLVPVVDRAGRILESLPLVCEIAGSLLITARKAGGMEDDPTRAT